MSVYTNTSVYFPEPSDLALIRRVSKKLGLKPTQFIRDAAVDAARRHEKGQRPRSQK